MSESRAYLRASVLTRVNYDFWCIKWCIKTKTIFKSHNIWKFVDEGYKVPSHSNDELTEKQQIVAQDLIAYDARALGFIQIQSWMRFFLKLKLKDDQCSLG